MTNLIADMSGTTFTQQLHASSTHPNLLPALAILLIACGFVLAMRSQGQREK